MQSWAALCERGHCGQFFYKWKREKRKPQLGSQGRENTGVDSMNQINSAAKIDVRSKFLEVLRTRTYSRGKARIVSFREAARALSYYRVKKDEMHELLYDLQQEGLVKIIPYHGFCWEEGAEARA